MLLFSLTSHNYAAPIIITRSIFQKPQNFGQKMDQFWAAAAAVQFFVSGFSYLPGTDVENWNGCVVSRQYDVLFLNLYWGRRREGEKDR